MPFVRIVSLTVILHHFIHYFTDSNDGKPFRPRRLLGPHPMFSDEQILNNLLGAIYSSLNSSPSSLDLKAFTNNYHTFSAKLPLQR
jgi:hypothetical protein